MPNIKVIFEETVCAVLTSKDGSKLTIDEKPVVEKPDEESNEQKKQDKPK